MYVFLVRKDTDRELPLCDDSSHYEWW